MLEYIRRNTAKMRFYLPCSPDGFGDTGQEPANERRCSGQ
jgi:GDP-D-mannose dehydratase